MLRKILPLILLLVVGPVRAQEPPPSQTVVLHVPGMTCQFCPVTIRKALMRLPGVREVRTDFESRRVTVEFDGSRLSIEEITSATRDAGYESEPLQTPDRQE
ncbi:MAG TPA: mercuric transport protein periplasmic component [Thiotrichales bacterium]|nr:mercuric transport protein periplasmic component [Thiotrichales bacterium]